MRLGRGVIQGRATALMVVIMVVATISGIRPASASDTHTVQPGDTLASLAEMHGVAVEDLAAANGLDVSDDVYAGAELSMPDGDSAGDAVDDSASIIDGVITYKQARSLSCEYASIFIATSFFNDPIYEEDSLALAPSSANPHFGFRGDIDGPWGITDDYGIYAEALVPILEAHGYQGEVSYEVDASYLEAQIDAGRPTLLWIATRGDTGFYEEDADGNTFKLVPWVHVVVAYGYGDDGVYVSDPGTGVLKVLDWQWFLDAWSVMDGMALAVSSA